MKMKLVACLLLFCLSLGCTTRAQNANPAELYHEPFRPQYHYSPPCRWMNDPNGLVYDAGEYHLFYQFNPNGMTWGPMHWGHAVSPDLVHWQTLPMALEPDSLGQIWSGSAVIDTNNTAGFGPNAMVAIYSYNTQAQGIAYSTDHGRTWTKYAGNPVIDALAKDFRDPKVFWHDESHQWVMVIAAGHEVRFFTSPDLRSWTYASRFAGGQTQAIWEVPDLFPLDLEGGTKWVLLNSVNAGAPAGGGGIQYFVGDFDGHIFTPEKSNPTLWLDYGPDNYAGTTWNKEPHQHRIYIGWMNNWEYGERIPASTWRGATTLPRQLRLVRTAQGIRLAQEPLAAFQQLRTKLGSWDNLSISGDLPLKAVQSRTLELLADIDSGTAARFGIDVQRGSTGKTRVVYNTPLAQILISRSTATSIGDIGGFSTAFGAPADLDDHHLRLHLFVDESSVEVFVNDGLVTMSSQTFVDPQNNGVALFAEGGTATLAHLEAYALASVWPKGGDQTTQTADFSFCN